MVTRAFRPWQLYYSIPLASLLYYDAVVVLSTLSPSPVPLGSLVRDVDESAGEGDEPDHENDDDHAHAEEDGA